MKKLIALSVFFMVLVSNLIVFAQTESADKNQVDLKAVNEKSLNNAEAIKRWVLVNIPARSLRIYDNDKCIAMYPVGVGTINTKTPSGFYKIVEKIKNPTWTNPEDLSMVIPAGVDNPLGQRWLGIGGNYGIHGTNHPESVGHYVSNGCIRMIEADVEKVFDQVSVGTPVQIIYNRLVIDKAFDGRIAYYIYPDGYKMQKLTVEFVKQGLSGFGVSDFVSDESINKAIELANGQPNYVASPVNIILDNKKLDFKAVNYQGYIYLPVDKVAKVLDKRVVVKDNQIEGTDINIDMYNKVAYMRLTDLPNIFDYNYSLNKDFSAVTLISKVQKKSNEDIDKNTESLTEKNLENKDENSAPKEIFPVKNKENVISEAEVNNEKESLAQVRLDDSMAKKTDNKIVKLNKNK